MKKSISYRAYIRIISYFITLSIALGLSTYIGIRESENYNMHLQYTYQRALSELSEYMDNIAVSLSKGVYANTQPLVAGLSASLWRDSSGAKSSLGQLPVSQLKLENTNRFLSQVGDFAMSLNKKMASGQKITDEERKQLIELSKYAQIYSKQITSVRSHIDNGTLRLGAVNKSLEDLDKKSKQSFSLETGLNDAEKALTNYPTLIYDGPFSDNVNQKESQMLAGKKTVTKNEARNVASKFSLIPVSEIKDDTDENGTMPSYGFKSGSVYMSVTKNGGYLCYMLNSRDVGEEKLSTGDAIKKAEEYLKKLGIDNMKESYYSVADGVCVINFAYVEGTVICYPDLIKVGVALDNGNVVSLDARGYLMNHHTRKITEPKISEAKAKSVLSPYLKVKGIPRLSFIPTDSGNEVYCYEFECTGQNNDHVLVYINAETGYEANILILIHGDNGIFTK